MKNELVFSEGSRRSLERNIFLSYLIRLPLTGFVIAKPVIYLWWERHGIGVTQIATLVSLFSVLLVLFEIPSGYVADRLGRKIALGFAALCLAAGALIYAMTGMFAPLVAAELCFALGLSLISGSDQAILFDSLLILNREKEFTRIWGNARTFDLVAGALLSIVGGYLGRIDLRLPFIVAVVFFCALFILVCMLIEPKGRDEREPLNPLKEMGEALRFCFWKSRSTAWLLTFSAIAFTFSGALDTYSQLYLIKIGTPPHLLGWLLAATTFTSALAAKLCFYIDRRIGFSGSIFLIISLLGIGLVGMGAIPNYFGLVFFLMPYFQRGYNGVGIARYINESVISDVRATALSFSNMISRLVTSVIVPGLGFLIDGLGIFSALRWLGAVAIIMLGVMFMTRPRILLAQPSTQ